MKNLRLAKSSHLSRITASVWLEPTLQVGGPASSQQAMLPQKTTNPAFSPKPCVFIWHLRTRGGFHFSLFSPAEEQGSTLLQAVQTIPPILFISHL